MVNYDWVIIFGWIIWVIYWGISSLNVKKSNSKYNFTRATLIRVSLIIIALILVHIPSINHSFKVLHTQLTTVSPVVGITGVIVCYAGLVFAIWARIYLGRNWGTPMTKKLEPELVTSGPYAYIRHPIYFGIIIAFLGTVIINGIIWFIALVFISGYFIYSMNDEEEYLQEQFPEKYTAYKSKTKKLIPFIY